MRTFLTLDFGGVISALLLGAALVVTGVLGGLGLFFLIVILYFLLLSAIVTRAGKGRKVRMGLYERSRGWRNVAANGMIPLIISIIYMANNSYFFAPQVALLIAYVASVAAITADKFASEIGVLDGDPHMLLTMKKVKKGISGAVSSIGLLASLVGAFLVSLSVFQLPNFTYLLVIATVAGFFGNLADSVVGYLEEQGIGNKYTSNMVCAIVGAVIAFVILA